MSGKDHETPHKTAPPEIEQIAQRKREDDRVPERVRIVVHPGADAEATLVCGRQVRSTGEIEAVKTRQSDACNAQQHRVPALEVNQQVFPIVQ